jgi:hypothetical protein
VGRQTWAKVPGEAQRCLDVSGLAALVTARQQNDQIFLADEPKALSAGCSQWKQIDVKALHSAEGATLFRPTRADTKRTEIARTAQ